MLIVGCGVCNRGLITVVGHIGNGFGDGLAGGGLGGRTSQGRFNSGASENDLRAAKLGRRRVLGVAVSVVHPNPGSCGQITSVRSSSASNGSQMIGVSGFPWRKTAAMTRSCHTRFAVRVVGRSWSILWRALPASFSDSAVKPEMSADSIEPSTWVHEGTPCAANSATSRGTKAWRASEPRARVVVTGTGTAPSAQPAFPSRSGSATGNRPATCPSSS